MISSSHGRRGRTEPMKPRMYLLVMLVLAVGCERGTGLGGGGIEDGGGVAPAAVDGGAGPQRSLALSDPVADHHKHMPSPTAAGLVGDVVPISADQIVAELNAAGTKRTVVLSV